MLSLKGERDQRLVLLVRVLDIYRVEDYSQLVLDQNRLRSRLTSFEDVLTRLLIWVVYNLNAPLSFFAVVIQIHPRSSAVPDMRRQRTERRMGWRIMECVNHIRRPGEDELQTLIETSEPHRTYCESCNVSPIRVGIAT